MKSGQGPKRSPRKKISPKKSPRQTNRTRRRGTQRGHHVAKPVVQKKSLLTKRILQSQSVRDTPVKKSAHASPAKRSSKSPNQAKNKYHRPKPMQSSIQLKRDTPIDQKSFVVKRDIFRSSVTQASTTQKPAKKLPTKNLGRSSHTPKTQQHLNKLKFSAPKQYSITGYQVQQASPTTF